MSRRSPTDTSKLRALIAEQAIEDADDRVKPECGYVRNATDTGITLDYLADRRPIVPTWRGGWRGPILVVLGCRPWANEAEWVCPACNGSVGRGHYCARCDTAGAGVDASVGHPVDRYPNEDYPLSPTRYQPGPLRGGRGKSRAG